MSYRVKLKSFEGPFDLLVYLIENAQMDIYDISIAEITSQYISYIEELRRRDVNIASEFMVLASALLEIKSRMLLPGREPDSESGSSIEDPRTELVQKLLEYKRFRNISEMLERRFDDTAMYLAKPQEDLAEYTGEPDEYLTLDIDKFREAFEQFLVRRKRIEEIRAHHRRTEKQRLTTELRMEDIKNFFRDSGKSKAEFAELVQKKDDRYDIAVTFSSLLEMMKERRLDAEQQYIYGNITVTPTDTLFDNEETD